MSDNFNAVLTLALVLLPVLALALVLVLALTLVLVFVLALVLVLALAPQFFHILPCAWNVQVDTLIYEYYPLSCRPSFPAAPPFLPILYIDPLPSYL